jgi:hypothetical protein
MLYIFARPNNKRDPVHDLTILFRSRWWSAIRDCDVSVICVYTLLERNCSWNDLVHLEYAHDGLQSKPFRQTGHLLMPPLNRCFFQSTAHHQRMQPVCRGGLVNNTKLANVAVTYRLLPVSLTVFRDQEGRKSD